MKKLYINIIILIIIFIIFELFSSFITYNLLFFQQTDRVKYIINSINKENVINWLKWLDYGKKLQTFNDTYEQRNYFSDENRYKTVGSKNKKPVVIFGCSFAYGEYLNDNQTFGYKLSKQTGRTVYNFAYSGWGPAHPIYLLTHEKLLNEVNNLEYIIYVLIDYHPHRITSVNIAPKDNECYLKYPVKNGKVQDFNPKYPVWYKSYFIRLAERALSQKNDTWIEDEHKFKNDDDLQATFIEWKNLSDKKWSNPKVVIFAYPNNLCSRCDFEKMKKAGITVLTPSSEIEKEFAENSEKYTLPDGHPNEKAWDVLVPYIVKQLKL